jgi:hypothetical protein
VTAQDVEMQGVVNQEHKAVNSVWPFNIYRTASLGLMVLILCPITVNQWHSSAIT